MRKDDLHSLPPGLPVPPDDGAADHLAGLRLPPLALPATDGTEVDLSALPGWVVVFAYPRTGQPDQPSLVPDWDQIPGARGCTPQTCGFRDRQAEFGRLGCRVFGLSTQDTAYQREMVQRLHVPFPVLSDARLELAKALQLPTFEVAGQILLKRLAWVAHDGRIVKAFYPVFPSDRNATEVLAWLKDNQATAGAAPSEKMSPSGG
jgi:peroxiredoxin